MPEHAGLFSFGPFRLDLRKRVLWRGDELVPLAPKALDLLIALVEQKGDVVRKEDLMQRVWPDTFVEEANLSVNVSALRKALGDGPGGQPYIQTVPRRGYRFLAPEVAPGSGLPSLAVMPLKLLPPGGEDEYLGLGIADALITTLSRTGRVVVRPTSAVAKYAGVHRDPEAAGRELKVDAVLDGTLQRQGGRVRVSVQLVPVESGTPTWAETFEEEATSLFELQDAVAQKVAQALDLKLRPPERELLSKRHTEDGEAYRSYLKGRAFWSRFTGPWLEKGMFSFQEAVDKDPDYALPHAGLADAYLVLGFSGFVSPKDAWPLSEASAKRALELDEGVADAHVSLAFVRLFRDRDWPAAGRELDRALALKPNSAVIHQWRGLHLNMRGRFGEAAREIARAGELDPLSLVVSALVGFQHHLRGDTSAHLEACRATVELDPNHFLGYWGLGLALAGGGKTKEALAAHRRALELSGKSPLMKPVLARTLALAGRRGEARRLLAESPSFYQQATVLVPLGEAERAVAALEKADEERDPWLVWITVDPMLDPLRKRARFRALEGRVFKEAARKGRAR